MKLKSLSTLALAVVLAAGVVGCKKKMDRVTPLPGYGAGNTLRDPGPGSGLNTGLTGNPLGDPNAGNVRPLNPNDTIPFSGNRSIEGRSQDRDKYAAQTVYFDFDRASVKSSEASKVQELANRFKSESPDTDLLVEGHCDERGTEGYNQALGERRALAIREMLVSMGVPADRIHTVSFGKDKPADPGHSESAWSKNRRGDFILVLPR
ncbi:MAG TPA: OmpA family protein [Candidatus Acidoferrum sp.]|nr:OmpA family protein [Candidatus Acidoferrum sp.]